MVWLNRKLKKELVKRAIEVSKNTFNPGSTTKVGAAVLTERKNIYSGCIVDSVISGVGTCAERCAIDNAVANGEYKFVAIAIYFPSNKFIAPCGVCLQYIYEFSQVNNKNIRIIMINKNGKTKTTSIRRLLPKGLGPREMGHSLKKYRR